MRSLARELLNGREDAPVRLVYGTVTAANTVRLDGESTAVVLPAITPVETGQRAMVLKSGGDRVIVGPVEFNQSMGGGVTSGTTDASGFLVSNHVLPFTPLGIVATPRSSNVSQIIVDSIGATTFRVRVFRSDGTIPAAASITFQWVAFK